MRTKEKKNSWDLSNIEMKRKSLQKKKKKKERERREEEENGGWKKVSLTKNSFSYFFG